MMKKWMLSLVLCLSMGLVLSASGYAAAPLPQVIIKTDMGDIVVELDTKKAPLTVSNFLYYVKTGYYDNTIFHRVINGFMIQGGGFNADMKEKATTRDPIKNEAKNGLSNKKYTIAMARTSDPHSATSQFFINVADNASLDYKNNTVGGAGYAVFGKVIKGMDVVEKIRAVSTGHHGGHSDVPEKPVVIESIVPIQ